MIRVGVHGCRCCVTVLGVGEGGVDQYGDSGDTITGRIRCGGMCARCHVIV
jgi:hypothetical protein